MGHAIEGIAPSRGHSIACAIDNANELKEKHDIVKTADVAIEFSTPATAADNVAALLRMGLPVVCGTTGWYDRYDEVCTLCRELDGALCTATNFSIGMNIMFLVNKKLAALMALRPDYKVGISETHHVHKLDAPSGTAITLRKQIEDEYAATTGHDDAIGRPPQVPIESHRIGEVPGIHTVRYDSPIDTITLTHEAHSRDGLATGAIIAAEMLQGRKGVFTMEEFISSEF